MGDMTGDTTQLQNLLNLASAGEDAAYKAVVNLAAQRLQRLTATMLRGYPHLRRWEDTSDVFQTAAIRLYQSLSEVRPDSVRSFFGLAATQIRRTLIDLARRHFGPQGQAAKHHSDSGASDGGGIVESEPAKTERPETLASWAEFHEAVERLADPEREVFELVWYGGMPQQGIASLLGVSLPTVKRRLRAARRQLATALDSERPLGEEQ